jgi:hypothetical protein
VAGDDVIAQGADGLVAEPAVEACRAAIEGRDAHQDVAVRFEDVLFRPAQRRGADACTAFLRGHANRLDVAAQRAVQIEDEKPGALATGANDEALLAAVAQELQRIGAPTPQREPRLGIDHDVRRPFAVIRSHPDHIDFACFVHAEKPVCWLTTDFTD